MSVSGTDYSPLRTVDDAKSVDPRLSFILFNHYVDRFAPSGNCDPSRDGNVEKLSETLE